MPTIANSLPTLLNQLGDEFQFTDFGVGVGRFEDYFRMNNLGFGNDRPFVLTQPILSMDDPRFSAVLADALSRQTPGYGGDTPETLIEALFQTATGAGWDEDFDGDTDGSGAAGAIATQRTPGSSGDVPPFSSFYDALNATAPVAFRVLDVSSLPLAQFGTPTEGSLSAARFHDFYRSDAQFGQAVRVNALSSASPANWQLFGPGNELISTGSFSDDFDLLVERSGTYVLSIGTTSTQFPVNYDFSLEWLDAVPETPPTPSGVPLSLNTVTAVDLNGPAHEFHYSFNLTQDSVLFFDSLVGRSDVRWTLSGPGGAILENKPFTPLDAPNDDDVWSLPAGSYRLQITKEPTATGNVTFKVVNLLSSTVPLLASAVPAHGALPSGNQAVIYAIDAAAGDRFDLNFQIDNSPQGTWGSYRLVSPSGQRKWQDTALYSLGYMPEAGWLKAAESGKHFIVLDLIDSSSNTYTVSASAQGNIPPPSAVSTSLSIPASFNGSLNYRNQLDVQIPAVSNQRLIFDGLAQSHTLGMSLAGPDGRLRFSNSAPVFDHAVFHAQMQPPNTVTWQIAPSSLADLAKRPYFIRPMARARITFASGLRPLRRKAPVIKAVRGSAQVHFPSSSPPAMSVPFMNKMEARRLPGPVESKCRLPHLRTVRVAIRFMQGYRAADVEQRFRTRSMPSLTSEL